MSRALWFNNVTLARRLLQSSELAKLHLRVSGGKVSIANPAFFDAAFNEVHAKYYDGHIHELSSQSSLPSTAANLKKQLKSRIQCFRRLQAAYWPVGKRLAVTGIKVTVEDGSSNVVQDPSAIQQALRDYWGPVYFHKASDFEKASKFLDLYSKRNGHLFEFASP